MGEDPRLADAYNGVPNQRAVLIEKQFTLDRELKDPNNPAPDITEYQLRVNMAQTEGWRWVSKTSREI